MDETRHNAEMEDASAEHERMAEPWSDATCGHSWPDRNSVRTHICYRVGEHDEHRCGACGQRLLRPGQRSA